MKIIILQLARLGDIVQTLPAVQGLKKKHPGCEITLVVRKTFADAARISPHVDKIVEMPTAEILGPALAAEPDKAESLARLIRWFADELAANEYDLALNLTFSPASAYLSSLLRAKERRGIHSGTAADASPFAIGDSWSQYFFAQVLERNVNILHVNDLFLRIAGVTEGAWPLELAEPKGVPVLSNRGRVRIGVQLTASRTDKTLPPRLWAHLCNIILGAYPNSEVCFFGSAADLPVIEETIKAMLEESPDILGDRYLIPAGQVRFHENIPWIRSCEWVIAPDTSIVHLSSAVGTKVIEIPLGPARPEETGPYGEGHHIVYPANAEASQLAIEIARIVGGEKARPVVAEAITRLTRCADGSFRNEPAPHNFTQEEASGFFMQAYYLLAEFRCGGRVEDIAIPKLGDPGQPQALDRLVIAHDALCSIRRLSEYGQHYCLKMLENIDDKAQLRELMAKLSQIEGALEQLKNSVSLVKPLIDTWRVAKDVAYTPGQSPETLEGILALTEELGQNVEIVQQLLQTAVEAAQKRATEAQSNAVPQETVPKERV